VKGAIIEKAQFFILKLKTIASYKNIYFLGDRREFKI
jgi:hypothetical protein